MCSRAPPSRHGRAGRGIPSVVTVRDYWPVCYRSDLIHTPATLAAVPRMLACRGRAAWPPAIGVTGFAQRGEPYLAAQHGAEARRAGIGRCAVIAVSSVIARDLLQRAPELSRTRLETIPNPVNVAALRQRAATSRGHAGALCALCRQAGREQGNRSPGRRRSSAPSSTGRW